MDDFREHLTESLKNQEFKLEYDNKDLRYKIIDILVGIRVQYRLSQAELAKKLGTTQAVISRIENGTVNIGIDFIQKIATTFEKKIEIKIS
jgi:predicted transcriptional regulator